MSKTPIIAFISQNSSIFVRLAWLIENCMYNKNLLFSHVQYTYARHPAAPWFTRTHQLSWISKQSDLTKKKDNWKKDNFTHILNFRKFLNFLWKIPDLNSNSVV